MVPFGMKALYLPKHPEVARINPKRQVPVLVDSGPGGDVEIFDSTQIFEYLEDRWPQPPLWPRSIAERTQARRLEHGSDEVLFPHVHRLMNLRGNPDPVDAPQWKHAQAGIEAYYAAMEKLLQDRDYLAGTFSYADIAFYMAQFFAARHTVPMTPSHPGLLAWRSRMFGRPAVRRVVTAMADYLRSQGRMVPELG